MLPTISKTLIFCIITCLVSLSHAISGSLDKQSYDVVEGGTVESTCTVTNRENNEDIWWQILHDGSSWFYSATSRISLYKKESFWENIAFENPTEKVFKFKIINISKAAPPLKVICGYVTNLNTTVPSFDQFVSLIDATVDIWVTPTCTYGFGNVNETKIQLTCFTVDYSNPSPGLEWYENDMLLTGPVDNSITIFIDTDTVDYGTLYVCQVDSEAELGRKLTCEITIPSPDISITTEAMEKQITVTTETIFMTQTTEIAPTDITILTTIQTNSTQDVGIWTTMMIIVVVAPGGTLVLILLIIIVACVCSCIKQNTTDKNINNAETGSDTNTKSDEKTDGANNHDTPTTNCGMKMNEKNETKNGKTDMRKDDAIPVYDDVANENNAEKTDKPNGEPMNNGQDKEAENMDKAGEEIPLYDNMRDDKVEKPDMSKANVEGLEYADIAIGSTMDGPPNSEDIIRKESATLYADLMV